MQLTKKQETILLIVWIQSLVAMIGSLFYSEVLGYAPCELCWYQRILMYPLVIIYGIALIKKEIRMAFPAILLSGIGMFVSIYHYLLQKVPMLQQTGGFCRDVSCALQYENYFGFITIPFLAGTAFVVIFISHLFLLKSERIN